MNLSNKKENLTIKCFEIHFYRKIVDVDEPNKNKRFPLSLIVIFDIWHKLQIH